MTHFLTVPINVDALVLKARREAVGPTLDVARAPWFGQGLDNVLRDHFPQTPNVAAGVRHDPLTPNNRFLSVGTHLHWAMPDTLTRGTTTNPNSPAFVERHGLWFPKLPNRWIVVRRSGNSIAGAWLVESDYVHPWGEGAEAVAYPVTPSQAWPHPYCRVGRQTDLLRQGPAIALQGETAGSPRPRPKPPRGLNIDSIDTAITAVGPIDPTFAALYTSCHSIFGAHDAASVSKKTSYTVTGWYASSAADPLTHWLRVPDTSPEAIAKVLAVRGEAKAVADLGDLTEATEQAREILFGERTGWALPAATGNQAQARAQDCTALLFHGSVSIDPLKTVSRPQPVSTTVAIGSSPREAVSAMLAHNFDNSHLETELQAINFGLELADHSLDEGHKLEEFRHSNGFTPVGSSTRWRINSPAGTTTNPLSEDTVRAKKRDRQLPAMIAHQLNELNIAQEDLDHANELLDWHKQQVYADWCTYMQAAYPTETDTTFEVDVDVLRDQLLQNSFAEHTEAEHVRDHQRKTLAFRVGELQTSLADFNSKVVDHDKLELSPIPGPRYWRPNDPSIAIDHAEAIVPTRRHSQDGRARSDGLLEVVIADLRSLPKDAASGADLSAMQAALAAAATKNFTAIANHSQSTEAWNPILVEWSAQVESISAGTNQRSKRARFDPDVIKNNFRLRENDCDLTPKNNAHYTPDTTSFAVSGRSILMSHGTEIVLDRLVRYLDELSDDHASHSEKISANTTAITDLKTANSTANGAEKKRLTAQIKALQDESKTLTRELAHIVQLQSEFDAVKTNLDSRTAVNSRTNVATFTLGGFMERLLMRRVEQQLPVADPLGFPQDQEIAATVAQIIKGASHLYSPEQRAPFLPLCNATVNVQSGRIVDAFGQFVAWHPVGDPTTNWPSIPAQTLRGPNREVVLRPRSVQGAKLNFRWLSASSDLVEANDHPASNPLCGWLVPNDFDQNVLVYDAPGELLGTVDEHGRWHPAPASTQAPAGPQQIANVHLSRVVEWLISRNEAGFTSAFLSTVDSALRTIEPKNFASHGSRALLVGRPVAITRARVSLVLQGKPASDISPGALARRIAGHNPSDHGFGQIRFPIRIGEHGQFNDGLVGYFVDSGKQDRHDILHAPQSSASKKHSAFIDVYDNHVGTPINLQRSFDDDPLELTLLHDPRCPVHATTGILPTKSLHLPHDYFDAALSSLQLVFSAMPVLTAPDAVDLPLPTEAGHRWSWLQRQANDWHETPASPRVAFNVLEQALPGSLVIAEDGTHRPHIAGSKIAETEQVKSKALLLWQHLVAEGWLQPIAGGQAADLSIPTDAKLGQGFNAAEIERLLSKIASRITPAERSAQFGARAIAREGWLKLTPVVPQTHPEELPPAAPSTAVPPTQIPS